MTTAPTIGLETTLLGRNVRLHDLSQEVSQRTRAFAGGDETAVDEEYVQSRLNGSHVE